MEERLKSLMQDLGNAINDSLSDSERIAEAIGEIKRTGYDVFLVLEATIGFNRREDGEESPDEESSGEPQEITTTGKVRFTTQDQRFLKALEIGEALAFRDSKHFLANARYLLEPELVDSFRINAGGGLLLHGKTIERIAVGQRPHSWLRASERCVIVGDEIG